MTSVSFDNIEIVNFDSTNPKSAVPLEYIDGLFDSKNLFFEDGNLGVGITNPSEALDVNGTIQSLFMKTNGMTIWNPLNTSAQDAFLNIRVAGVDGGNPYLSLNIENETEAQWSFGIDNFDNKFRWKNTQNFSGPTRMILDQQGFLGLGGVESPKAELTLPNTNKNKKIILYDVNNNLHQFSGFGSNSNELRYQVVGSVFDHVFYSGIDNNSSKELLRIKGNGRIGVGTNNPVSSLTISVQTDEAPTTYGLQVQSQNNNSKGAGLLLTNNGVGGASFGIVSESGKLNFVDQVSTPSNFLSLDRQGGLELKNSSRTNLWINGNSGNIGIGTTGPQSQLHIFNTGNSILTLESSSLVNQQDAKLNISQSGATSGTGINSGINRARVNLLTGPTGGNEVSLSLNKTGDFSIDQIKINNQLLSDSSQNKLSINRNGNVEITQNLNVRGKIQENGSDLLPTGTILPFAGENVPTGFLLCDGKSYSSTDISYNRLFGVILRKYGGNADPNNPTFKVPDLQCRFPLGAGSTNGTGLLINDASEESVSTKMLGSKGGTETHRLKLDELASHNHGGNTTTNGKHSHSYTIFPHSKGKIADGTYWQQGSARTSEEGEHFHNINRDGKNFAHENMPPYLVINYIIKL